MESLGLVLCFLFGFMFWFVVVVWFGWVFLVCVVGEGQGEESGLQHFPLSTVFNGLPASSACSGQAGHQLEEGDFQNVSNSSCTRQKKILQRPALHI